MIETRALTANEKLELLRLTELAIKVATGKVSDGSKSPELRRLTSILVQKLEAVKDCVQQDKFGIPQHTTKVGLGLSRAITEWCEDEDVLTAIDTLESFFRSKQTVERTQTQ